MLKQVLVLTTSAVIWTAGSQFASAQVTLPQPSHPPIQETPGVVQDTTGQGGPGAGTFGPPGMMGPPAMMRIIFTLMDTDGDGTVSLQEFQAAHERIFKAIDSNKDGRITFEEMQTFMQVMRRAGPPQ